MKWFRKIIQEESRKALTDDVEKVFTECSDCGALLRKEKAKFVLFAKDDYEHKAGDKLFYCGGCKPKYDVLVNTSNYWTPQYKEIKYEK